MYTYFKYTLSIRQTYICMFLGHEHVILASVNSLLQCLLEIYWRIRMTSLLRIFMENINLSFVSICKFQGRRNINFRSISYFFGQSCLTFWHLGLYAAPTGPPENFEVKPLRGKGTAVTATWDPPEETNGRLRGKTTACLIM